MILPQNYQAVLFLMVLSLLCLGSWASAFKFAGNWRFELFYLDFAIGLLLASVILAFTLGNIGYDGFNFLDDLQHVGKRQWMWVFLAGLIFNFGNMLLMAAVSVSGLAGGLSHGNGNGPAARDRSGDRQPAGGQFAAPRVGLPVDSDIDCGQRGVLPHHGGGTA